MTDNTSVAVVPDQTPVGKSPVFDEELGTYICGYQIKRGLVCKARPYAPAWKCIPHGGGGNAPVPAYMQGSYFGIYSKKVWSKYDIIQKELAGSAEAVDQLFTTDIINELGLARIMLIELVQTQKPDEERKSQAMAALKLVAQIAKIAKEIQEKEQMALKREFIDSIITAIVHAFTRSNTYTRPSDRARVFMSEFSNVMPGVVSINLPVDGDMQEDDAAVKSKFDQQRVWKNAGANARSAARKDAQPE